MKKRLPSFRPLIRETGPEPFTIHHEDFNSMVRFFHDHHKMIAGTAGGRAKVPHAWKMQVRWSVELEQWVVKVTIPGFVRGWDVQVSTSAYLSGPLTRLRLELPEEISPDDPTRVDAFLTEFPEFAISEGQWDDVVSVDTARVEGIPSRAVPEWLQRSYNILVPPNVTIDTTGLTVETDLDAQLEQDRETARLLKAVEVVLRQPRPAIVPLQADNADERYVIDQTISYARPSSEPPYLVVTKGAPVEVESEAEITARMALEGADLGYDVCPIATIWLCGPAGDLYAEKASFDWVPLIQYHTHYCLDYTVNDEINSLPALRLLNPAAGLLSAAAVQPIIDSINEYNRQVEEAYRLAKVNGQFWTV